MINYFNNLNIIYSFDKEGLFTLSHHIENLNKRMNSKNVQKLFELIISTSQDGLYVCDREGNTLLVNEALLEITNIDKETFYSYNLEELIRLKILPKSCAYKTLQTQKKENMIIDYYHGKKAVLTSTPVFDQEGKIFCVVSNVRDITELNNLHKQLEQSNRLKTEYEEILFDHHRLLQTFDSSLIYKSSEMEDIVSLANKLASTDSPILLLGESGSGKDVLARYIHQKSKRKGKFIKVNCAAIPGDLFESELFGYEKGAFTGANTIKQGLFELANHGTIYLDEIGDMPLKLQVKILNIIEEKKVRRISGKYDFPVNTRIIAATNVDLERMVEEKKFRKDLYFRLNVLPITLPPLRERKSDIPILTFYFLHKLNKKYNENKRIDPNVIDQFLTYDWPGNVRELSNIVERMFHMSDTDLIDETVIPESIREFFRLNLFKQNISLSEQISSSSHWINRVQETNYVLPLKQAISTFEKQYLVNVINKYDTLQETANALQISLSTLMRKKRKYNIAK